MATDDTVDEQASPLLERLDRLLDALVVDRVTEAVGVAGSAGQVAREDESLADRRDGGSGVTETERGRGRRGHLAPSFVGSGPGAVGSCGGSGAVGRRLKRSTPKGWHHLGGPPLVDVVQAMNSSSSRSSLGFGCAPTIDLTTSPLT